ncbi:hypothetical protein [Mesonia algae]|nr:hypothetical protein [Mesonia algae]
MKKTQVHLFLLLFSIISCRNVEQEKLKTETFVDSSIIEQKNEPKVTNETTQAISSPEISEVGEEQEVKENKSKLKIKFTKIDSTEFLKYNQKYSNEITVDTTIVNEAGGFFTLDVENAEKKFSCDIDYNNCNYYKGFLKPLNKYILTYCGIGYCGTYLLDKNTGTKDYLESPFDSECKNPSISKNKNKLIAFSSSVFDRESFIALYKMNIETKKIDLKKYDSFYTSDWRIKEIIWIDNNVIALKVFEKYGGKTGGELINTRYLKGKIE